MICTTGMCVFVGADRERVDAYFRTCSFRMFRLVRPRYAMLHLSKTSITMIGYVL